MFTWSFWILLVWLVVNGIWMWFDLNNQQLQKTFAWINVVAIIWGFWAFYGATPVAALSTWFQVVNWVTVIIAVIQFYFGYRNLQHQHA